MTKYDHFMLQFTIYSLGCSQIVADCFCNIGGIKNGDSLLGFLDVCTVRYLIGPKNIPGADHRNTSMLQISNL